MSRTGIAGTIKRDNRIILYCAMVSVLFFGVFVHPNFATDTYFDATTTTRDVVGVFLRNGRIFTATYVAISKGLLGLSIAWQLRISYIIAIVATTLSIYIVYKILASLPWARKSTLDSPSVLLLLATIIVINPFYIEYYSFYEQGIMCLGVLFSVLAAFSYNKCLSSRDKVYIISCLVFNMLSLLCYQGCYGIFLALAGFVALSRASNLKRLLTHIAVSGICYAVPALIELVIVRLMGTPRAATHFNLLATIRTITSRWGGLFNFFGILFPYFPVIFLATLLFIAIANCAIAKNYRIFGKFFLRVVFVLLLCLLGALAPVLAERPDAIDISPRIIYPFGTIIGLLLATTYATFHNKYSARVITVVAAIILLVECYHFNSIAIGRQQLNALDRYKVSQIQNEITSYETKRHKDIKRVSFVIVNFPGDPYPINNLASINLSAFRTNWSDAAIINLYTGRHYERVEANTKQVEYCLHHAKPIFTADQIQFDGDKAIVCSY